MCLKEDKNLEEWKIKNSKGASYAHFDRKIDLASAFDYITNDIKVKQHSFYPFVTYDQIFYKFKKEKKDKRGKVIEEEKVQSKIRKICYSAHIDRYIYKYYGYLLNEKYNCYLDDEGISNSVVAYRTNLHKNNIHFAKEAIDFIKKSECNIIVGDFKGFFDNLDHRYLKKMLCEVLDVKVLPDDWYAVYKNITKYSTWDLIDILKINELISVDDIKKRTDYNEMAKAGKSMKARKLERFFNNKIKELNGFNISNFKLRQQKLILTKEQFKNHSKKCIKKNDKDYGIPQGSSISAVLSNVYMIKFDKEIFEFVQALNGLYLRYSDDFIIILPKDKYDVKNIKEYLDTTVGKIKKLELQKTKTQIYTYSNNKIINITNPNNEFKSYIDYLGFIFDGKEVTLRPKTVSKYYYRMYKKLNHIKKCKGVTWRNNEISYKEIYRTYTEKGKRGIRYENNTYKYGNFFSYIDKAEKIFNPNTLEKFDNYMMKKEPINRYTKRHMLKIRRVRDKIDRELI